ALIRQQAAKYSNHLRLLTPMNIKSKPSVAIGIHGRRIRPSVQPFNASVPSSRMADLSFQGRHSTKLTSDRSERRATRNGRGVRHASVLREKQPRRHRVRTTSSKTSAL